MHKNADLRIARHYVLNGFPIPVDVTARLLANGFDVGELERRLIDSQQYKL